MKIYHADVSFGILFTSCFSSGLFILFIKQQIVDHITNVK